ncbi:acyl carrier protein [Eleftheria terrae]|uniref:acyl carrier protein n=1 Tax=Eleftheria terrae TaxID=1597781 RepID=UPI00263B4355|nr:acyl carrier protein [Eleftheria terrae]WKB51314.1 acyl carrier protein [Eleftheria terrae]
MLNYDWWGGLVRKFQRTGPATTAADLLDEAALKRWLVWRLATYLKRPQTEIDTTLSFDAYGLDSIAAIKLSGELEKLLERRLSPALLFDHDNIDQLSAFLASELQRDSHHPD